eukprot:1137516-Pelagomonas_calceolata.AAC.2
MRCTSQSTALLSEQLYTHQCTPPVQNSELGLLPCPQHCARSDVRHRRCSDPSGKHGLVLVPGPPVQEKRAPGWRAGFGQAKQQRQHRPSTMELWTQRKQREQEHSVRQQRAAQQQRCQRGLQRHTQRRAALCGQPPAHAGSE